MTMPNSLINWFSESFFSSLEKTLTHWDSQRPEPTISLLKTSERSCRVLPVEILTDWSVLTTLAAACKVQQGVQAQGGRPLHTRDSLLLSRGCEFLQTQKGVSYVKGAPRAAVYTAVCEIPPSEAALIEVHHRTALRSQCLTKCLQLFSHVLMDAWFQIYLSTWHSTPQSLCISRDLFWHKRRG